MQFISNLAQMVKSPQEDEAKTQDTALDRPKDDHPPQAADPIEAPVAKPTRRRTLPDPKLVRAARLRRRADALPVAPATEDDHGEEQAIAQFLSDATEDKAPARTEPTSMWEAAVFILMTMKSHLLVCWKILLQQRRHHALSSLWDG